MERSRSGHVIAMAAILAAGLQPVNEDGCVVGWCGTAIAHNAQCGRRAEGARLATRAEVERQLQRLMARLDGNQDSVRSAIPSRRVLRCLVTDLGTAWYSVVEDGRVSQPTSTPPDGAGADVTLRIGSDDLVDLVEGRTSFLSAFTSGRVRVDASIMDLLRLRTLL